MFFIVLVFIRAPFYVLLVFIICDRIPQNESDVAAVETEIKRHKGGFLDIWCF